MNTQTQTQTQPTKNKMQLRTDLNWDDIANDPTIAVFGPRTCGKARVMKSLPLRQDAMFKKVYKQRECKEKEKKNQ